MIKYPKIDELFIKVIPFVKEYMKKDGSDDGEIQSVLEAFSSYLNDGHIEKNDAFIVYDALGLVENREKELDEVYKNLKKFALPKKKWYNKI